MTSAARACNAISEIAARARQLRTNDIEMLRRGRCARRRRRRRRWRAEIEIHGWRFLRSLLGGKEWTRRKSKHSSDHVCREASHGDIVFLDDGVEFVPLDRNSILGSLKLCLKAPEVFGGGELRIIFRDHQQT